MRLRRASVALVVTAVAALGLTGCGSPSLTVETALGGLTNPWDLGFTPDGTLLFTERPGRISALIGGQQRVLADPDDVVQASEAGMMGMAIDPQFASNRLIYTCLASTLGGPANDVRLVRWRVNAAYTALEARTDIITGIPVNASGQLGRHSGCRPRFGPDGYLWVGTGDAAIGTTPQSPTSLAGKVLRVTRVGAGAPGNPGGPLDPRIYTYGHRNVQGLAFRPSDGLAFSAEHGPDRDDEVNRLSAGVNFGWNPLPGAYNEAVPMTDLVEFPSARPAVWSSGSPPVAPSGATFLTGTQWKSWDGALVLAALRGQQLRVLFLDGYAQLTGQQTALTNQGRLRTPVQGPDGKLYVTTDAGNGAGKILRITPS